MGTLRAVAISELSQPTTATATTNGQQARSGLPQAVMELRERFVCLYRSPAIMDVNKLQYHIFASKAPPSDQIPPTKDAL